MFNLRKRKTLKESYVKHMISIHTKAYENKKKANNVYKNMTPLCGNDIAETILWSINRPSHVNINRIELMPLQQGFNIFAINRTGKIN